MKRFVVVVAGLSTVACLSSTTPDVPVELLGQQYGFACGKWSAGPPPTNRTVFDLRLLRDGTTTAPDPGSVAAIEAAGGRIVYLFHGPLVRAELDVQKVPELATGPRSVVSSAATVVAVDAHDVTLIVILNHDLTTADLDAARALGGRITHEYAALGGYAVVIDDARVPELRALPGVDLADFDGVMCLA